MISARSFGSPAWRRGPEGDRGSETVEIVVILTTLMVILSALWQLALWGLAAHALSMGVAEAGAEVRSSQGPTASAKSIVTRDVGSIAGSLLGSLQVHVSALPDKFLAVTATGTVPTILPGLELHVSAQSTGPQQGFRASG